MAGTGEGEVGAAAGVYLAGPSINRALQRIRVAEDVAAQQVASAMTSEPPQLRDGGTVEKYRERHIAIRVVEVIWSQPAPILAALVRTGVLDRAQESYATMSRARKVSAFGRALLDDLRDVNLGPPAPAS